MTETGAAALAAQNDMATRRNGVGVGAGPTGMGAAVAGSQPVGFSPAARALINIKEEPTQEIAIRWPMVLENVRLEGLDPSAVRIRVYRTVLGAYPIPSAYVGEIDGRQVCGYGDFSASAAVIDYITDVYHQGSPVAARYECEIDYKSMAASPNGRTAKICKAQVTLEPYAQILQRRNRQIAWDQRQRAAIAADSETHAGGSGLGLPQGNGGSGAGGGGGGGYGGGGYSPSAPMPSLPPWQPYPYPQPPAPAAAPAFSEELVRSILDKILRGEPIGPQPPAPVVNQGFAAPPPAPPPPSFREQLAELAAAVKLVREIDPQRPGVGAVAGVVATPAAAPVAPPDPMAQFRGMLAGVRELDKFREEIRGALGGDGYEGGEEPAAPEPNEGLPYTVVDVPGVGKWPLKKKDRDFGMLEQAQAFAFLNPDMTGRLLQGVATFMDRSTFAQLIQTLMQRGNAAQQAAAREVVGMARPAAPPPRAIPAPVPAAAPTIPAPGISPQVQAPTIPAPPPVVNGIADPSAPTASTRSPVPLIT